MGSISLGKSKTTQQHQKSQLMISRRISCLIVALFPSLMEENGLPPPQGFSRIWMWIVLKATIDTGYTKSWMLTAPQTIDLPWKLDGGWISLMSRDDILCHCCSHKSVENEANTMLECPLYNLIREKCHLLLENVVLRSLEFFFSIGPSSWDISLYLTNATSLCHSRDLTGLTPSWCTLSPCSLLSN